ncbi:synaptic vesicle 2-related protein-like isoform X3 [Galleria mellonella]|uniref:Synaptic vesicle 2-related protein-like isoform X3 n=1 Tax=Galleria mellonella TaxID=7137 RepID=A0ABM3MDN2_GALME|nr:synaptic vesicle 2-related protein-like isoform X3 [Galleria mellonella]
MAAVNESYDKTGDLDDIEMNSMGAARKKEDIGRYSYEEALDLTGHGKYNLGLLMACFMVITAMGIDIFGLGIIVTAATCDLGMGLAEIGVLSSMPFAGIIVMSYPWGYLSDTRGRKLVLMWAMCGSFLSSVFSSFAPNWQMLAAFRFISSALSSAAESATYALLGECCAARLRARYMLLVTSALMITPTIYYVWGYLIMKLDFSFQFLAIVYRPWRLLTQVMALPLGLGALMLYFYSESPKFLANVGRNEESIDVLKRIYVKNGGDEKDFPVKEIYLLDGSTEEVGEFSLRSLWTQIAPLFKPPLLTRTILLYYLTFVIYIAYVGTGRVSVHGHDQRPDDPGGLRARPLVLRTQRAHIAVRAQAEGNDHRNHGDSSGGGGGSEQPAAAHRWAGPLLRVPHHRHGVWGRLLVFCGLVPNLLQGHGGMRGHDGGEAERVLRHEHREPSDDRPLPRDYVRCCWFGH